MIHDLKRLTALLLALVMLLAFSACAREKKAEPAPTAEPAASPSEAGETADAGAAEGFASGDGANLD